MCSNVFELVQTCSNVFKVVQNLFKAYSNVFKCVQNLFKCVQICSNLFKTCSNVFKCVQMWCTKGIIQYSCKTDVPWWKDVHMNSFIHSPVSPLSVDIASYNQFHLVITRLEICHDRRDQQLRNVFSFPPFWFSFTFFTYF